jgi:putative phosphoribosyl transferase
MTGAPRTSGTPLDGDVRMSEETPPESIAGDASMFSDRQAAGERLAVALLRYWDEDPLILGIPCGGVQVAAVVAQRLGAELDVVIARKVGVPDVPELAMGAVTAAGVQHIEQEIVARRGITEQQLAAAIARETEEAKAREERFRGGRPQPRIAHRTVIVVDDGIATGATLRATLQAVRAQGPARLVAAVPVGPHNAHEVLQGDAEDVVCLYEQEPFEAVGVSYEDFGQVTDETVERILRKFQVGATPGTGA